MSLSGWPDGAKIRRLREAQNLSVKQLAERVGIARQYLSLIELGVKKQPSIDTLAGIARELGQSLGELVVIPAADGTEGDESEAA
jgi:transcriptional regulator with XRE-family HTH domain